jgi:cytochrome c-type biogenesis protein CcmH/NrfG
MLLKGDLAFQGSHYENALAAYEQAYHLNSSSAEARRKIAVVLTLLDRSEEAAKYK